MMENKMKMSNKMMIMNNNMMIMNNKMMKMNKVKKFKIIQKNQNVKILILKMKNIYNSNIIKTIVYNKIKNKIMQIKIIK